MKTSKEEKLDRFTVVIDELDIHGRNARYSYIKVRPGVCVITKFEDEIICLKEFRHPIKSWSYEFTCGMIEDGETPEETAIREVKEETGCIVDKLYSLGEFYPSFGATDETIHLFLAQCEERGEAELEFTEFISMHPMGVEEVNKLIKNGEFKHGAGLAAWLKAQPYLKEK
ncbi:MAG: NUDIX hydrolase [Lachnospiraceae bacterium]|nr:NUDIX hydrolase [Lachnospiraceae bacterium]